MIEIHNPESVRQAERHATYAKTYRQAGLCAACSYQVSYGHQLGFSTVHPPCKQCAPIVATFPIAQAGLWRSREKPEVAI